MPAWQLGSELKQRVLPTCLFFIMAAGNVCWPQSAGSAFAIDAAGDSAASAIDSRGSTNRGDSEPSPLAKWLGLPVREIDFEGVLEERLKPLPGHLPQAVGTSLDRLKVADSIRFLYATG